ncbi:54S ribosomal protein L4 [Colletotrichum siamense]|uniref:54S ribosomal protein L4 n=1 Tax=Colletotrichum siamense TaxID=690259 RepID=UPI0018732DC9|nr:54S ribosomal protein L4 [Colletotrichum siamense]KAF5505562.1 54S ribosomal protein L4 [Colletotrichum siamense]
MANPTALRPAIGRMLRLQETRQWLPANPTSVSATRLRIATSAFSTSAAHSKRKTRDSNRLRGVSSMRKTGPREPLSVSWEEIPQPADYKPKVSVDPKHGLWDFFYGKKLLQTPKETQAHGRAWSVRDLRKKSWDDLHSLWYVCLKERNRLATARKERARRMVGFGEYEGDERDDVVRSTMRAIKHVLTERYYVWEDARKLAAEDPEINLWAEEGEPAYSGYVAPAIPELELEPELEPEVVAEDQAVEETSAEQGAVAADGAPVEGKTDPAAEVDSEATPVTSEKAEKKKAEEAKKAGKKQPEEAKKAAAKPVDLPVPKL